MDYGQTSAAAHQYNQSRVNYNTADLGVGSIELIKHNHALTKCDDWHTRWKSSIGYISLADDVADHSNLMMT